MLILLLLVMVLLVLTGAVILPVPRLLVLVVLPCCWFLLDALLRGAAPCRSVLPLPAIACLPCGGVGEPADRLQLSGE